MHGLRVEVFALRDFHRPAQVHHHHPVADLPDDREIVGDENQRQAELVLQFHKEVHDLGTYGNVERADRLIADHDRRPWRQCPGDPDALTLASGKLVGVSVQLPVGEPHTVQDTNHPLIALRA